MFCFLLTFTLPSDKDKELLLELHRSMVSQVRHYKEDYGQIHLSGAGDLFCWGVLVFWFYGKQANEQQQRKVLHTIRHRHITWVETSSSKLYKLNYKAWDRSHEGSQQGEGRNKLAKRNKAGIMPNICIPEPGRPPSRTSFTSKAPSVRPTCCWSTKAACLCLAVSSKQWGWRDVHCTSYTTTHLFMWLRVCYVQTLTELCRNPQWQ